jgi:adenylate kinase family enzyme
LSPAGAAPVAERARIHITGASGSGTSTLGAALAGRLGVPWHDTDSYFWLPSDPAYVTPRPMPERLERLSRALDDEVGWVLSGSLDGWGDALIPRIGTDIFLHLPGPARLARLQAREVARFGARIAPGGDMHQGSRDFVEWAARYDTAGTDQRSLARHEAWLAALPCPVLRLDASQPPPAVLAAALAGLGLPAPAGG